MKEVARERQRAKVAHKGSERRHAREVACEGGDAREAAREGGGMRRRWRVREAVREGGGAQRRRWNENQLM